MNDYYYPPQQWPIPPMPPMPAPQKRRRHLLLGVAFAALALMMLTAIISVAVATRDTHPSVTANVPTAAAPTPTAPAPTASVDAYLYDRATYQQVGDRDFAVLMKDPDTARGHKLIIFGVVTQFDAATGRNGFRASVAASPQTYAYQYEQNAMVNTLNPSMLADVVQGDVVTMYVTVLGSVTYDTALMNGHLTVPMFQVNMIDDASRS